jgi:hypothetical protein
MSVNNSEWKLVELPEEDDWDLVEPLDNIEPLEDDVIDELLSGLDELLRGLT